MKDIRNDLLKVTCNLKRMDDYITWAYPSILYSIVMPIYSRIRIIL